MRPFVRTAALTALALTLVLPGVARAQSTTYDVTITNLTRHQVFSTPVAATHAVSTRIFHVGDSVDMPFWLMAEDGEHVDLVEMLEADPGVGDVAAAPAFLMPGHSVTLTVESETPFFRLSVVGMLVTTNDGFFGIDSHPLTVGPWLQRLYAPVYDAGTEANSESCETVPGPPCGSLHVRDTGDAEGTIGIHSGIHGTGDLDPAMFDWKNPVAEIRVVRRR
ncbi:MAG: spondin domain-containing protein [Acidobacteriota bacterium]|jgi:hypothetical protein